MIENGRLLVLYGSQTFTAQEAAEKLWRKAKGWGFRGPVLAMDDYPISQLIHEEFALFVCATTGQGDEPDNMKKFWKFLLRKGLPANSLCKLKFGVVGLGDSSYAKFNFVAKKLHKRLVQLGATPLLDAGLCDYQHDLGHDAVMIPWVKDYHTQLKSYFPNIPTDNSATFIPRWRVSLIKDEVVSVKNGGLTDDIYFRTGCKGSFCETKLLEVNDNIRTTDVSHFQDVRLLTFHKTDESKLEYEPGDLFNIRPRNSKEAIDNLFSIFESHNLDIKPEYRLLVEECYKDMPVPHFLKHPLTIYEVAEQYWDLNFYPTQYVFSLLALVSEDKLERDKCIELSSPEGQEDWLNYCRRPKRTILEVLQDFHKSTSKLTIEVLFELFSSIKPRSFSIASSSLYCRGQSLELLVALVNYKTKLKKERLGLASNWLGTLKKGDQVYGWLKKGSIVFPNENTPAILIGPGTGLAAFRSLIFERAAQGIASKDTLVLFFGCRYKNKDFHCKSDLEKFVEEGKLTLVCAFSRDQEDKEYVQHKISSHSQFLWTLINDKNAHIFISGNAKNMPGNVKDAFIEDVFNKSGGIALDEAKNMIKDMEKSGRLQLETW